MPHGGMLDKELHKSRLLSDRYYDEMVRGEKAQ